MKMYRLRTLVVAMIFLLPAAFAWTQDTRDDAKPQQEEAKPRDDKAQEQAKPSKDEKQDEKARPEEAKPARDEHEKVQSTESERVHTTEKTARIPDEKFRANFGREHTFTATRVIQTRTIVAGQARFVYGGYNFIIVDPWPTGWVMTDACYIDFIDGEYFLVDVVHPQFRIGLSVVL